MFHGDVVESDAFYDLPPQAQALYLHLTMEADDDGFVAGPRQVARRMGTSQESLDQLVAGNFLYLCDGVGVIRHFRMGNSLKNDRIQLPRHPEIAKKVFICPNNCYWLSRVKGAVSLATYKRRLVSPNGFQTDSQKRREEKKREEKRRKEKKRAEYEATESSGDSTAEHLRLMGGLLGKGVVLLSEEQVEDLLDKLGLDGFHTYVERLADFIINNDAKIRNHYATICKWWLEDKGVRD